MVTGPFAPAQTPGGQKPVFIHANCDGQTVAAVLGSLKEQMAASRRYVVIPRLDANGKMEEVLEIYMHCTQRGDVVAVATSYGKGRCLSENRCGSMIDGSSIKSTLCDGHEGGWPSLEKLFGSCRVPHPSRTLRRVGGRLIAPWDLSFTPCVPETKFPPSLHSPAPLLGAKYAAKP